MAFLKNCMDLSRLFWVSHLGALWSVRDFFFHPMTFVFGRELKRLTFKKRERIRGIQILICLSNYTHIKLLKEYNVFLMNNSFNSNADTYHTSEPDPLFRPLLWRKLTKNSEYVYTNKLFKEICICFLNY